MLAITIARWCLFPVRQSMAKWAGSPVMHGGVVAVVAISLFGTALLAASVTRSIGSAMVNQYGAKVALFTDSFVAPRVQELAGQTTLSEAKKKELDGLFVPTVIGRPILAFRIWSGDQIIYSNSREMIGRSFPMSRARARA